MIVDLLEEVPGLERVYSVINQVSVNYLSFRFCPFGTRVWFYPKRNTFSVSKMVDLNGARCSPGKTRRLSYDSMAVREESFRGDQNLQNISGSPMFSLFLSTDLWNLHCQNFRLRQP